MPLESFHQKLVGGGACCRGRAFLCAVGACLLTCQLLAYNPSGCFPFRLFRPALSRLVLLFVCAFGLSGAFLGRPLLGQSQGEAAQGTGYEGTS